MTDFDTMLDLLDHGCDGEPRWIALDAANADAAASLVRVVADEAERRGYVPLGAERFRSMAASLPDEQRHRTFALLQTCAPPARPDPSPLVAAALVNPRPHVLITIAIADPTAARTSRVREARAVYAPNATPPRAAAFSPECARYVARAAECVALARRGRHQAAVRGVSASLAAVVRRRDCAAAAHIGMVLGRLLLERGRVAEAEDAFAEAAAAAGEISASDAAAARVWLAVARTDAGRLTEAEAVLRAVKLTGALADDAAARWADAALARCLLWQDRAPEAAALLERGEPSAPGGDPFLVVMALATHARVLLAEGRTFDAGQRARAALEWADRAGDPMLRIAAGTAHLRVLTAAGDLELAAHRTRSIVALAKEIHAPLRAMRARALWAGMLRRAGRTREADSEFTRLVRAARTAPTLVRRQVEQLAAAPVASTAPDDVPTAVELVRLAQDEEDDRLAAGKLLERFAADARTACLQLQSAAGGAMTAIVACGGGVAPSLGARAFDAGIAVGPECVRGSWEMAVPVRLGHRMLGALAGRWPLGRELPARAAAMLNLAAAILAPRVELLLMARIEAARATVEVPELIGVSEAIADVRRAIVRAASAPFAVLIEGESGAGKELVARAIHHLGPRRDRRFCDVNSAALPDDLVESELFGHAKGAFTGALVERPGLFEEANGGTLFLDELPDLSLRAQAKLLRVIQQGEIRRVGESFPRRVDVRIVAAANRAMNAEVAAGRFRQDLLYRLDVIRIRIPPLRDRPEDIPVLAQRFWKTAAERAGTRATLSHGVMSELARYAWPGNVRELQNVMSALAVAAPSRGLVRSALLPGAITGSVAVSSARLCEARRQFERRFIQVALARAGGSRTRAAAQLGISRQGLLKLMARLGVTPPAAEAAPAPPHASIDDTSPAAKRSRR